MAGHVAIDICARRNQDIVTDDNLPDDYGVDADPHTIAQFRSPSALAAIFLADGTTLVEITVSPNN